MHLAAEAAAGGTGSAPVDQVIYAIGEFARLGVTAQLCHTGGGCTAVQAEFPYFVDEDGHTALIATVCNSEAKILAEPTGQPWVIEPWHYYGCGDGVIDPQWRKGHDLPTLLADTLTDMFGILQY